MNFLTNKSSNRECVDADPFEAFPDDLKIVPPEVWTSILQFLPPQDLYRVSLTCRLWNNVTQDFFGSSNEQFYDCIHMVWDIVAKFSDSNRHFPPKSNEENSSLNVDVLNKYSPSSSNKASRFKKACKKTSSLIRSLKPFSKKSDSTLNEILQEMEKILLAHPTYLYIGDLHPNYMKLSSFRYAISKLNVGANLIFLGCPDLSSRLKKTFYSHRILSMYLTVGALNGYELRDQLVKNVDNLDSLRRITLLKLNSGDNYDDSETCLFEKLSAVIRKISSSYITILTQNSGIQDKDAFVIADMIKNDSKILSLKFVDENELTNEGIFAIEEAMRNTRGRFFVCIKNNKSELNKIREGIDKLRECSNISLTVMSNK